MNNQENHNMTNLFDLDQLANAQTGTPGAVTVTFGVDFSVSLPSGQLLGDLHAVEPIGTAPVGTIASVLEATGAVKKLRDIENALTAKGQQQTEGYSLTITGVDGTERIGATDLADAMNLDVSDGDLIAIIAKVSGRSE